MKFTRRIKILALGLILYAPFVYSGEEAPRGGADSLDIKYKPARVLYDMTSGSKEDVTNLLDRISYLSTVYESDKFDSSIVVIIHGDAIPLFAIENMGKYSDLMGRANDLTVGTTIEFRMCHAAARAMNYKPEDIHGFVNMVPMADAEIVRLQKDGYAYMK